MDGLIQYTSMCKSSTKKKKRKALAGHKVQGKDDVFVI